MTDIQPHYYAARKVPHGTIGWANARNYDITFVFTTVLYRTEGVYQYEDDDTPYYTHRISWEEFDLLTAFGVSSRVGFKPAKILSKSNSWQKTRTFNEGAL